MADQPKQDQRLPVPVVGSVRALLQMSAVKARFEDVLKERAPQFIASLANLVYSTPALKEAEPYSVIAAALVAASLDLPVDKNLGFAFIIPYQDNKARKMIAQFQMGYKGYIQLAHRTSQYAALNATEIYEGEIKSVNRITGDIVTGERKSDVVIGYACYMRLVNGFEKTIYMTVDEIRAHAAKFSKNYGKENGQWKTNFHGMALKTVIRRLLTKWGVLSVEMQRAIRAEIPPDEETPQSHTNGEHDDSGALATDHPDYTDPAVVAAEIEKEQAQKAKDKAALFPDDEEF